MAGKKLNWCARCHHAIVTDGQRHWVHFSNDDWAGKYDCCCTIDLLPCSPRRRAQPPRIPAAVEEEVARMRSRPRELYGHDAYIPVLPAPQVWYTSSPAPDSFQLRQLRTGRTPREPRMQQLFTWTAQEIVWTGTQTWTNRGESVD